MGDADHALAATVAGDETPLVDSLGRGSASALGLSARSTVLPRLVRVGGTHAEHHPVGQRFVPLRVLGKGGLGEVTLVQDNDIDRPVALKRLHANLRSEEVVFRFAQEIRTVGQLEHPNIAPIHDVGIDDAGQHYFVMRYVEGETLHDIIQKLATGDAAYHARFTMQHRVQIFFGVLHAIAYAHSKNIIHRDIKPANIMVGPYGEVMLMDWGVAKKKGAASPAAVVAPNADDDLYRTRDGSLVGTPAYMSPEQARGDTDQIDERSDVYALAVVLYELLALEHYLGRQTSVAEMLVAIADGEHTAATFVSNAHQSPVPAELGWFIEKGLAKDPAARYQSVAEMTDHLESVMAGAFPIQCPVTFLKKAGGGGVRFVDRHPALAMVGAPLALGIFLFGVVELLMKL
jgi:serine/threonine protein kinase